MNSFISANQPQFATDESVYYGRYARLLYHFFGIEGPFEISPNRHIPRTPRDTIDVVKLFTIELDNHPVLFIEVKPHHSSALDSKRKRADDQMRDPFRDLRHNLVTPRLRGISAFGTRVAFFDVAPAERWGYDLLAHSPRMLDHGPNSLF
jgi:hypothetical protein